jgi:2Fe-2S ferredoxin
MIQITVEDRQGLVQHLKLDDYVGQNLMETLKGHGYDMRATCGGLALCADCHCLVLAGESRLEPAEDAELTTLDTRPDAQDNSRLSCQIRVANRLHGTAIRLMGYAD